MNDTPKTLTPLPIPVTPALDDAVGYIGNGSWYAMYWEPAGDEVMLVDRWNEYTGYWSGFLAFVRRPDVAPHLCPYDLGSSELPATHWLLIDRRKRKAYIALVDEARRFIETLDDSMPEFNRRLGEILDEYGWDEERVRDLFMEMKGGKS